VTCSASSTATGRKRQKKKEVRVASWQRRSRTRPSTLIRSLTMAWAWWLSWWTTFCLHFPSQSRKTTPPSCQKSSRYLSTWAKNRWTSASHQFGRKNARATKLRLVVVLASNSSILQKKRTIRRLSLPRMTVCLLWYRSPRQNLRRWKIVHLINMLTMRQ